MLHEIRSTAGLEGMDVAVAAQAFAISVGVNAKVHGAHTVLASSEFAEPGDGVCFVERKPDALQTMRLRMNGFRTHPVRGWK